MRIEIYKRKKTYMGMFFMCKKYIYLYIFYTKSCLPGTWVSSLDRASNPCSRTVAPIGTWHWTPTLQPLTCHTHMITHIYTWLHTRGCNCPLSRLYVKYIHKTYKRTGRLRRIHDDICSYHDLHSFLTNHYGINVPRKLVVKAPPWKRRDS